MLNTILEIVKNDPRISDWTVYKIDRRCDEMYLVGTETESLRQVVEEEYSLTLLVNGDVDGTIMTGSASYTFGADTPAADIKNRVDELVYAAGLAQNPAYTLDDVRDNEVFYQTADRDIITQPRQCMVKIKNIIETAAGSEPGIELASAEIFLSLTNNRHLNSRGLDSEGQSTNVMVECVFLAGPKDNQVESHLIRSERFIDKLQLPELLRRYLRYAKENSGAITPPTGKYNVIFTEEALDEFWGYAGAQTAASMVYNRMSQRKEGQDFVDAPQGDRLTLSWDPTLPGHQGTAKYDGYGTLQEKHTAIQDNVIKGLKADKRFATYLGCPVTGSGGNMVVAPGKHSYKELATDNTLVLARFSTFTPNAVTGAFSGEIRSGLWIKDGKEIPVKGGSVTGNMTEALKKMYLSSEVTTRGIYHGPEYIKMLDLDIAGE